MRVAVDAMGGDFAPREVVAGAVAAAREDRGLEVLLVGKEPRVRAELAALPDVPDRVRVIDAPDVIEMADSPVESLKKRPGSSILRAMRLVAEGEASSCVAAGSTGAAVAAAMMCLPRLKGVKRPGIAVPFPASNRTGACLVIDVGANPACRPEHLLQYAVMGSNYFRAAFGEPAPRVALLSIGEEEGKGNQLVKDATRLLKSAPIRFIGNAEGKDLFRGGCEVAVTDGFVGNIILKSTEGFAEFLLSLLKEKLPPEHRAILGELARRVDYAEFGGAPLLGMAGTVMICHGRSDRRAIANAVRAAARAGAVPVNEGLEALSAGEGEGA